MTTRLSCFAAASALLAAAVCPAAEIVERHVTLDILPDGGTRTAEHLVVRLESARDVEAWSPYAIPLDENRRLEDLSAVITRADGSMRRLGRSDLDTVGEVSESIVSSSTSFRLIRFADAEPGSTLTLDFSVRARPFYPTASVLLQSALAPTTSLLVTVRGGGPLFRHRLWGTSSTVTMKPGEGGLVLGGSNVPMLEDPTDGPARRCAGLRLSVGWSREGTWEDVARWWVGLASSPPPPGAGVEAAAREVLKPGMPPAEAVDAILSFVHAHVRYVAVEVGIGGWQPADPETTLARGWGDCKALALLTAVLLRRAGIGAELAAATVGEGTFVDPEFPMIGAFDHLVVAVPAQTAGTGGIVDETGTWALVDPTTTTRGLDSVPAHLRDRHLLILRESGPALVRTAPAPDAEARRLRIDVTVAEDGSATGTVALDLTGERAAGWQELAKSGRPSDLEVAGRRMLASLLPAVELQRLSWGTPPGRGAAARLEAEVSFPTLLATGQSSSWFQAGGPVATPPASAMTSRSLPFVLTPQVAETTWRLRLPAGWRLLPVEPTQVGNDVGTFSETVRVEGQTIEVTRRGVLRRCVVDPTAFGSLREVATAEHRALRRRLLVERTATAGPASTP